MTGDPVTPFLVDAYRQGLLKGHEEEAYRALKKNADDRAARGLARGRARRPTREYLADGYVPYIPAQPGKPGDYDFQHGPSATLEYALADADARRRWPATSATPPTPRATRPAGQNYRNIFDPRTGFFRARDDRRRASSARPTRPQSEGFHEGTPGSTCGWSRRTCRAWST